MIKANAHFVDSDIDGVSGLESWEGANYGSLTPDPAKIQIYTAEQLAKIGVDPAYPRSGDYELMNDIDLLAYGDWTRICTTALPFTGSLDGNRFTISGMRYYAPETGTVYYRGLFGRIVYAVIENLVLYDCKLLPSRINGNHHNAWCGILAGGSYGSTIRDVHLFSCEASFKGNRNGGFIGESVSVGTDYIRCCSSNVVLKLYSSTWGTAIFLGNGTNSTFTDCYAQGSITQYKVGSTVYDSGGILGDGSDDCVFTRCYASVSISGATPDDWGSISGNGLLSTYTDIYFDSEAGYEFGVEDTNPTGVNPLTTSQMYDADNYANWDFVNIWKENSGAYPTLRWLDSSPLRPINGYQRRTTAMPTNYSHLNGELVQVLGDGNYLGTEVVVGGAIALDNATAVNHVGLPYTSTILPMKLDGEAAVKRVRHIVLNVNNSLGGNYGRLEDSLNSVVLKTAGDIMDTSGDLHTGHVELPFDGRYDRQGDIYVTQDKPLPMRIVGMAINLSNEEV